MLPLRFSQNRALIYVFRPEKLALFGSYGWGDGEWMRTWEKDCSDTGIALACESVACCDVPDDTGKVFAARWARS